MFGAEPGHFVASGGHPDDAVLVVAVPAMRIDDDDGVAVRAFVDAQLRVAADDLHGVAVLVEDVRVACQGVHAAATEHVLHRSPVAMHLDRRGGRAILFAQKVHRRGIRRQALQGHAATLGPSARARFPLLARVELEAQVHLDQIPDETLARLGLGCARPALVAHRGVGHQFQRPKRALPRRNGEREIDQRPGAERRVQRIGVRCGDADALEDRRALGGDPRVAVPRGPRPVRLHERLPVVTAVRPVAADPTVAKTVAQHVEAERVRAPHVDGLFRLGAERVVDEGDLFVPVRDMAVRGAQ